MYLSLNYNVMRKEQLIFHFYLAIYILPIYSVVKDTSI